MENKYFMNMYTYCFLLWNLFLRTCTDIDECTEFEANDLCIGTCGNTPGSYVCKCPYGYKLGSDGRTCQGI